ncbi:N-terminal WSC domain-containing protein [Apiospora sp. TS-2023a]
MRSTAALALTAGAASALMIPATTHCQGIPNDGDEATFGCPRSLRGIIPVLPPPSPTHTDNLQEGSVVSSRAEREGKPLPVVVGERPPPPPPKESSRTPVDEDDPPPAEENPVEPPPEDQPPVVEPAPWTPPPPPADPAWKAAYRRCFTDGVNGVRALDFGGGVDKKFLTIDVCLAACGSQGFKLAGLEFGTECYCGNTLQGENRPTLDEHCDLPCLGNNQTTCGGRGALALYVKDDFQFTEGKAFDGLGPGFDGYEPVGCYQDFHAQDRTLKVDALRGPEHHAMTPELCIADCKARGFPLAGLEYGRQCFCGMDRSGRSNKTEDFFCNQGCTGNAQLTAKLPPSRPLLHLLPLRHHRQLRSPPVEAGPPAEEQPPAAEPAPAPEPAPVANNKEEVHHRPDDITTLHRRRPGTDILLPPDLYQAFPTNPDDDGGFKIPLGRRGPATDMLLPPVGRATFAGLPPRRRQAISLNTALASACS